jgi:ribulose kinase
MSAVKSNKLASGGVIAAEMQWPAGWQLITSWPVANANQYKWLNVAQWLISNVCVSMYHPENINVSVA